MPHHPVLQQLIRKYDLRWEPVQMMMEGRSIIDAYQGFGLRTRDEVERFIAGYGFDLNNPIEAAELFGTFHEALRFVRKYFLKPDNIEGVDGEIPRRILDITDLRDLFLYGSGTFPGQRSDGSGAILRDYACAVVKVMHVIVHADKDLRGMYFPDIQKQIMDAHYRELHRTGAEQKLYLGDPEKDSHAVELVAFETKPKKNRDSLLIKLLHKSESIAEDIFDRLGIRYITHHRLDALRVVNYLQEKMIVIPANLKITRSRNTLVDLDALKDEFQQDLRKVFRGELDESGFVKNIEAAIQAPGEKQNADNKHTSEHYRAIQMTSRHLIKFKNSLYDDLRELKGQLKKRSLPEDVSKLIERLEPKQIQKEVSFFYPYEIQVVDQKSFIENEQGRSAHSEYKKQQVHTAMKRVMGPLLVGTK